MKCILMRAKNIKITANKKNHSFSKGLILILGIEKNDTNEKSVKLSKLVKKTAIFNDHENKIKISPKKNTNILVVPNFTLAGEIKKGKIPDFSNSMKGVRANAIFRNVCERLKNEKFKVFTGFFGEHMQIENTVDGPVIYSFEL
tara:strand:+ start:278 stop:709 length:432 start_codon:yes stop_codon:yes gene_type:complete